jgi:hypothetical protein
MAAPTDQAHTVRIESLGIDGSDRFAARATPHVFVDREFKAV